MERDKWSVTRVAGHSLRVSDDAWPYAVRHRAAIAAHWTKRSVENPTLFNGGVFVLRAPRIEGGIMRGTYHATDFASFLYWREMGFDDLGTHDGFACAMVRASDGGYLVGRAAPGSLNDGFFVLPGGLVDRRDVTADGAMDVAATARRELHEETGLNPVELVQEPGLHVVAMGPLIGFGVTLTSADSRQTLVERVQRHLASTGQPELSEPQFLFDGADAPDRPLVDGTRLLLDAVAREHPQL